MTKRSLAPIVAIGALSIIAAALYWRGLAIEKAGSQAREALETRVAALEKSPSRGASQDQRQSASRPLTGADAPQQPSPGVDVSDAAPMPNNGDLAEPDVDLGTQFEAAYVAEPVDRDWAGGTRQKYLSEIEKHLPATSRIESFECRSARCRLEVVHESVQSSNDFLLRLFAMEHGGPLANTSGGFRTTDPTDAPGGGKRYVVFIARAGTQPTL